MPSFLWEKSYPQGLRWGEPVLTAPLYELLFDAARNYPQRNALDFLGYTLTYAELLQRARKAAEGFRKLGVEKGVKVGLFLPNCPHYIISYFGILLAGGTVVNFSPLYALPELEHQLNDSDTEILVTLNLKTLYPKAEALLGKGSLRHIVVGTLPEMLPSPKNVLFALFKRSELAPVRGTADHTSFFTLCDNLGITNPPAIDPLKDMAIIQYTGGMTGVPKGAVLTHANVYSNTIQSARWFSRDDENGGKLLAVLPFFHVFAMTTCLNFALARGMEILLLPRFDARQTLETIAKKKPALMPAVPTLLNALLNSPHRKKYNLKSLKLCVSGGAPLPVEIKRRFEEATNALVVEGYGLTEASPVTHCNPAYAAGKEGSIGLPFACTEVRIESLEEPGRLMPTGESGELCVSGPQVMQGYYKMEAESAHCLFTDDEGKKWLRTGDIAFLDKDGYTFIIDRKKEMVIVNGYNVFPRSVEEALYTHDSVLEACVFGVPDSKTGERIIACVVCKEGKQVDTETLLLYLKARIGKHELPREIRFCDTLPKTPVGKILKRELKQSYLNNSL